MQIKNEENSEIEDVMTIVNQYCPNFLHVFNLVFEDDKNKIKEEDEK